MAVSAYARAMPCPVRNSTTAHTSPVLDMPYFETRTCWQRTLRQYRLAYGASTYAYRDRQAGTILRVGVSPIHTVSTNMAYRDTRRLCRLVLGQYGMRVLTERMVLPGSARISLRFACTGTP
eukprot:3940419-Rhodomonas_salina.2